MRIGRRLRKGPATDTSVAPAPPAAPPGGDAGQVMPSEPGMALKDLVARTVSLTDLSEDPIVPGLRFRLDPEAGTTGTWESPQGRLVHLRTKVSRPARWLGLHLALPDLADMTEVAWFGAVIRTSAAGPAALRLCLRSGLEAGGFIDLFAGRHILAQPAETDGSALFAPSRLPDLPVTAPWRELIVFLPPGEDVDIVVHDLRVFVL